MNTFTYSQSRMREGLAIYTAASEQPFSFGEYPNFVEFQQNYVNLQYERVSRNTIRADTVALFNKQKQEIIANFTSYNCIVSCTSDMRSGKKYMSYFCVTCHFIDQDWMI